MAPYSLFASSQYHLNFSAGSFQGASRFWSHVRSVVVRSSWRLRKRKKRRTLLAQLCQGLFILLQVGFSLLEPKLEPYNSGVFVSITAMQPVVISFNKTTFYPSSELMKHKTRGKDWKYQSLWVRVLLLKAFISLLVIGCTGKVKQPASLPSSRFSLLPTT